MNTSQSIILRLERRHLTYLLLLCLLVSNALNGSQIDRKNLLGLNLMTFFIPGFSGYYGRVCEQGLMEIHIPFYYVRVEKETRDIAVGLQFLRYMPEINEKLFVGAGLRVDGVFRGSLNKTSVLLSPLAKYGFRWSYKSHLALDTYLQMSYLLTKTSKELRNKLFGVNSDMSLMLGIVITYRM